MIVIIPPLHYFLVYVLGYIRSICRRHLCSVWCGLCWGRHICQQRKHAAITGQLSLCLWFVFTYYLFFINIKKMLLSFIKHVWKFKKYWNAQKIYIFIIFMILNLRSPCMSQTQSSPCQSNLSTNRTWTTSPRAWPASPRRIQHLGWLLTPS